MTNIRRNKTLDESRKNLKICQLCDNVAILAGKWCSEKCKDIDRQRSSESYSRLKVFERDRGVCAECHVDCQSLSESRKRANTGWQQFAFDLLKNKKRSQILATKLYEAHRKRWVSKILRLHIPKHLWKSGALWYADHLVPVYRGGGATDASNRQTLCWDCHKKKTAMESKGRKHLPKSKKTTQYLKTAKMT